MKWLCRSERKKIIKMHGTLYELATAWRGANAYHETGEMQRYSICMQRLENALNKLTHELLDKA